MRIKCPHCGKPTSDNAAKCVHCLGKVKIPIARSAYLKLKCPRCGGYTDIINLGGIDLDLCNKCYGLWFDKGEFKQFENATASPEINKDIKSIINDFAKVKIKPIAERTYIDCPICSTQMGRINYAKISGIIVDRCVDHGTWLDHEDANKLLELMEGGGKERLLEKIRDSKNDELNARIRAVERKQMARLTEAPYSGRFSWGHFILRIFEFY